MKKGVVSSLLDGMELLERRERSSSASYEMRKRCVGWTCERGRAYLTSFMVNCYLVSLNRRVMMGWFCVWGEVGLSVVC